MNPQDRMHLLAERKFLRARLAQLPESARVMRINTQSHLRGIEQRLANEPTDGREPAHVRLTFNGRPVVGSHGIFAEFAMRAVNSFTEAVSAVAASLSAPLAAMGPIPNREQHQLLITNTALGSFGFELEEYQDVQALPEEASPVAEAVERTQALLQGTLGTDDQLADSAADTDPRALDKVRTFLQILADYEATCAVQYRDRSFRFADVGQVRNSLARLSQENLQEAEQVLQGEFQGVLPKGRTFEFKLAGDGGVVRGKIGPAIQNAAELNARLNQTVTIRVMVTRVGNGRSRYLLMATPPGTGSA
jgi:hypothetical protein